MCYDNSVVLSFECDLFIMVYNLHVHVCGTDNYFNQVLVKFPSMHVL